MSIEFAYFLVRLGYLYVTLGLLLLPWWHLSGLRRLDSNAGHGSWGFRILVSFGLIAFWPWLILSARHARGQPRPERNAHRDRALKEASP